MFFVTLLEDTLDEDQAILRAINQFCQDTDMSIQFAGRLEITTTEMGGHA
jgi:hypothetical protein